MLGGRHLCTARTTDATILTWVAPWLPPYRQTPWLRGYPVGFAPPPSCTAPPYASGSGGGTPTERIQVWPFRRCERSMGCGGAIPTPQVQFQVMPRTSSSGKRRQSLSVSKVTAVAARMELRNGHTHFDKT